MAVKLTSVQQAALEAIRAKGTFHSGNGINRATAKVLAREGLIELEWAVETWYNPRSGRNHSAAHWTATAVN